MFDAAADIVEAGRPAESAGEHPRRLLIALGYDGDATAELRRHRAALLRVAGRCERVFQLDADSAPGAVLFGAEVDPERFGLAEHAGLASLAGRGLTAGQAFESCIGEGVEYLSYLERPGDVIATGTLPEQAASLEESEMTWLRDIQAVGQPPGGVVAWMSAERLPERTRSRLPRDLCVRRPATGLNPGQAPATSSGCAAGSSLEEATLAALLELVERDAVALWWHGRRPAGPMRDGPASATAELLARIRAGARRPRMTRLFDVTTDLSIPAVAAVSTDPDGRAPAFGFAAHPDAAAACRSAVLELCQMELAQDLVLLKQRQRGADALNDGDRRVLRRMSDITLADCPADDRAAAIEPAVGHYDGDGGLRDCLDRLAGAGYAVHRVDLSRPALGIPAVRVVVPGLQELPPRRVTARLSRCLRQGGRDAESLKNVIPLI